MNDRYEPAKIDVERDEGVTVTYLDGYIVSFDLLTLRARCPCATCRGIRDQGEEVWPRTGSPTPLRIVDARIHGAWGLAITSNDGHATGICSVASFGISGSHRWMKAARSERAVRGWSVNLNGEDAQLRTPIGGGYGG